LRGTERQGGLFAALLASSAGFPFDERAGMDRGDTSGFAGFATLGLIAELTVRKELLLARGKTKVVSTFNTNQNPIDEVRHSPPLPINLNAGCR
jgi:hypothetical protein